MKSVSKTGFWSMVKVGHPDECWPWSGSINVKGYGRFACGIRKDRIAHREAYRLANGLAECDLPQAVCHHCDNPPCCNPDHLFGGTYGTNNLDMHEKGRGRRKLLLIPIMQAIHAEYLSTEVSTHQLAREFGVAQTTVYNIVNERERWVR